MNYAEFVTVALSLGYSCHFVEIYTVIESEVGVVGTVDRTSRKPITILGLGIYTYEEALPILEAMKVAE